VERCSDPMVVCRVGRGILAADKPEKSVEEEVGVACAAYWVKDGWV